MSSRRRRRRKDVTAGNVDKEMLKNLDLLLNYEAVQSTDDWELLDEFEEEGILSDDFNSEAENADS